MNTPRFYIASAPSNIAFIKYWGKSDTHNQWPANDSISMTLDKCRTVAKAKISKADSFYFCDQFFSKEEKFAQKAYQHIERLRDLCSFTDAIELRTNNTFPSSVGIASSASSMAAITIACLAAWTQAKDLKTLENEGFDLQHIAKLARLGSGSACRSVLGGFVHWQKNSNHASQQIYKLEAHADIDLCDIITLISTEEKPVSSSEAHEKAWSSPLFLPRLAGIGARVQALKQFIQNGNFAPIGELVEQEALDLHAIAMSSEPSIRYLNELSSSLMAWVRLQRQYHGLAIYFTLDAGPNVHILCKKTDLDKVTAKLNQDFPELKYITDQIGAGPSLKIENNLIEESDFATRLH